MRLCAFQRSHSLLSLLPISRSSCSHCCRGANTSSAKAPKHRSLGLFGELETSPQMRTRPMTWEKLMLAEIRLKLKALWKQRANRRHERKLTFAGTRG